MKKGIIISCIVGVLLITMAVVPYLFKSKISEKVKLVLNESINAKIDFSDIELSLFRSFPELNISIKNLTINGVNEFENIPLLNVSTISTSVNLSTLWSSKGLTISSLLLQSPTINLVTTKGSRSNWDISKKKSLEATSQKENDNLINLDKIEITEARLSYLDDTSPLTLKLQNGNFQLSGALRGDNSLLKISGEADSLSLKYKESTYLSNLKLGIRGELQSNFDKMSFKFLSNQLLINKLPLELQGDFILGENEKTFNLNFKSASSSITDLLGFIPAKYEKYVKGIEAQGSISFGGFLNGIYSKTTMPGFGLDLKIAGGKLKYPKLPDSVDNITINAKVIKEQGAMDLVQIDLKELKCSVASNPLTASLHVATPLSDPQLTGNLNGRIDFGSLKKAIPMDSIDIKGTIDAILNFNGKYSAIEKGDYENFKTEGKITLDNFIFTTKSLPQTLEIKTASIGLNPKSILLTNLLGRMGESDFTANGSISNYWSYLLKSGTLGGNIAINSNYINFNQLFTGSSNADSTAAEQPYKIPTGLNISIQAIVNKARYDRINITGIAGKVTIGERKVVLDGLNMNMLNGKILISGSYITPREALPDFDFKMNLKDFDLPTAYQSSGIVRHFLPIANQSTGTFNSTVALSGKIGPGNTPQYTTLNGGGMIAIQNIELIGSGLFSEVGKYFKKGMFTNVKINDFVTNFKIAEGGLVISPFNTRLAGQDVTISGKQSVNLNLDYRIDFKVSKEALSEEVTQYIGFVPGAENISKYPIGINLSGTYDKPEIKVDLSEAKDLVAKEFKKKAGSAIQDAIKKFGLDKLFK
jgi:AsmA-like C-terminal region